MTPEEFVQCFVAEKETLLQTYFMPDSETDVGMRLGKLGLDSERLLAVREILDGALTDAFYTVLLAIDGEASLGGKQILYKLLDDNGTELTGGEIEAAAWEAFHGEEEA
jgi:hypothetical protein